MVFLAEVLKISGFGVQGVRTQELGFQDAGFGRV